MTKESMLPEYEIFMNVALVKDAIQNNLPLRMAIGIIYPQALDGFIVKYKYDGNTLQGDIRYIDIDPVFDKGG